MVESLTKRGKTVFRTKKDSDSLFEMSQLQSLIQDTAIDIVRSPKLQKTFISKLVQFREEQRSNSALQG